MSLRSNILILVAFTFIGLVIILSVTLETTLQQNFNREEYQSMLINVQRAQIALQAEFHTLNSVCNTLAQNDSTFTALSTGSTTAFANSLPQGLLTNFQIQLVAVYKLDGTLVFSQTLPSDSGAPTTFPKELDASFQPGSRLFNPVLSDVPPSGLLFASSSPWMLSHAFIIPSDGSNLPQGLMVIGKPLDQTALLLLGETIQLPLDMRYYSANNLPSDFQAAHDRFDQGHTFFSYPLSDTLVAGYTWLPDLENRPAFILRIQQPRTTFQNGVFLTNFLVIALVAASAIFGLLTLGLLETLVFSRLSRLEKEVRQIGSTGDIKRRVKVTRKDEISSLSTNINLMLENLEKVQDHLLELELALRQRVDDLAALNQSSQVLLSRLDTATMLENLCKLAVADLCADYAWVGSLNSNRSLLRPLHSTGIDLAQLPEVSLKSAASPQPPSFLKQAILTGEVSVGVEEQENPQHSLAAIPFTRGKDKLVILVLCKRQTGFFSGERLQLLLAFANLANMAYQNAGLYEQVKLGRERLQSLSLRLVEVQEQERRKIAIELHDEIGQILTGLKLILETSASFPADQVKLRLENALLLVNDLIKRVRRLSLDLRPTMLDDLGLLPSLLWHFERYTEQTGIQVDFEHSSLEGRHFSSEIETTTYRIVQEALTNIARHAQVQRASVRISANQGALSIQVEDRGRGFDPETVLKETLSSGLLGMQERVALLGGQLSIDSSVGQGACLTVRLPYPTNGKETP
jgi:signal transduction histidine kinase